MADLWPTPRAGAVPDPSQPPRKATHWREVAAVSAAALLVTLVIAAPVLRAPSERLFGMAIVGRHHDPFTVMAQFDRPLALGVYTQPVTDVAGALLARVAGPVAAYNWLVLLSFPFASAAAYLLARHLALSPAGAAVAALAFAFSPFHLAHAAYHVHIAQTAWLPLYLLALWRCLDDTTPAAIGLLGAATAGAVLSNFYGGLIAAVITPVAIGAYWLAKSRFEPGSKRRLALTTGSLLLFAGAGVAYVWAAAPAVVADSAAFAFPRADLFRYSAKWWSYLVPPVAQPFLGDLARHVWSAAGVRAGMLEQQVSLGWGVIALGLVAAGRWLRRDRQPAALVLVPVLVVVAVAALACSLSPERRIGPFTVLRPSALLYGILPMFRAYARFGVIVQLMAALLAGLGVQLLSGAGTRRGRIACASLLLLAAGEYAVWPPSLWRDVLPTAAHRWVAQQPDGVRVLDCTKPAPVEAPVPWLTGRQLSLLGGRFEDCAEPNLPDKLAAEGFTHLLVRRENLAGRWFARALPPDGLRSRQRFGDSEVFAVTTPAPPVYTAALRGFAPRVYEETKSWRRMEPGASWAVVNRSGHLLRVFVDVELTALDGASRLQVSLDGREAQVLLIDASARRHRLGPLALTPGDHELLFRTAAPAPPSRDPAEKDGRPAPAVACGDWRWTLSGEAP